jgi:hypothetical protein
VHAADGDELIVELDAGVGQARTQDVLAEAAAGGCGAGLTTFGLFGRGSDAVLVSGIVSRVVKTKFYTRSETRRFRFRPDRM